MNETVISEGAPGDDAAAAAQDPRAEAMGLFLAKAGWGDAERAPLAGDASHRRYLRLKSPARGGAVLMDAPPERGEDVRPFAALTGWLRGKGFSAPKIFAADLEGGFLLLEDYGDALFARDLAARPAEEPWRYQSAVDVLIKLHQAPAPEVVEGFGATHAIQLYDWEALRREARLFTDWYLPGATGSATAEADLAAFEAALKTACEDAGVHDFAEAPPRLTLRDYHAENLIWLEGLLPLAGAKRVGLLDYQDALAGHPAYDLVSLLEDARRDVPPALASAMIGRYCAERGVEGEKRARFEAAYAVLGAQRNLKILGIFARLWRRDGKDRYLSLLPRVWGYLERDLKHPALAALKTWLDRRAPAPTADVIAAIQASGKGAAMISDVPPVDAAMVLAAGLGTRLRPLTETTPKPLIEVAGKPLIEHALERVAEAGAERAVVNVHHLADQMRSFVGGWNYRGAAPALQISDETGQLLETGGGCARALPLLERTAFFVVNSDNIWTGEAPLKALSAAWDPERMDALLLLCPIEKARGYARFGDFSLDPEGRLVRRGSRAQAPLVYTGAQILKASALEGAPPGPFSLNRVWDHLIAAGRAYGVHHLGGWCDVGGFAGLAEAEQLLAAEKTG